MTRVHIGPSRIHAEGLFTTIDITKGTKIIRYIGKKITQEESDRRLAAGNVYIFGLNALYAIDGKTSNSKFDRQHPKISQFGPFSRLVHLVQGVFLRLLRVIFPIKTPK